mmetsp:Transcript_17815/g.37020  ORF Transcript_17815/g.37020 Transcript_17815/m.37020 type:complete len:95 (+) Transcript_17815:665-949(+)
MEGMLARLTSIPPNNVAPPNTKKRMSYAVCPLSVMQQKRQITLCQDTAPQHKVTTQNNMFVGFGFISWNKYETKIKMAECSTPLGISVNIVLMT